MKTHNLIRKISTILLVITLISVTVPVFSGTVAMAEAEGVWVLTSTEYYTPSQRISNSNEYYKYDCSFDGFTQDGAVRFSVSGGYQGPGDWFTGVVHHECTQPESSYAPGETVTLTMTTFLENSVNGYKGGEGFAQIDREDLESQYDGRDRFFWNTIVNFNKEDGKLAIASPGEPCTGYANMPKNAEYGEKVAVVFIANSASDSHSRAYEYGYGGYQFYEWIYTFMGYDDAAAVLEKTKGSNTVSETTVQETTTTDTAEKQTGNENADNLLVNPNWEGGLNGWETIDSVEEEYEEEKTALRSIVYQDIDLTPDQEGTKISFGGWICVNENQSEQDQIRISLSFYKEDGTLLSYDSREEYGYDLVYHEINMSVPLGADYMKASISIRKYNGNNSFSFDGLNLTVSHVSPSGFSKSAG